MPFVKKEWVDRVSEYPTRRKLVNTSTSTEEIVTVQRYEGEISQEGDAFSAANMNDLEDRIDFSISSVENNLYSLSYNDLADKPTIPAAVAVKGNAESAYRTGNVNLTPANIGAATDNHVHGQITNDGKVTTNVAMANGDAFLIADASASNLVKQGLLFWSGTLSAYNAISSKNSNTIYFITE